MGVAVFFFLDLSVVKKFYFFVSAVTNTSRSLLLRYFVLLTIYIRGIIILLKRCRSLRKQSTPLGAGEAVCRGRCANILLEGAGKYEGIGVADRGCDDGYGIVARL